MCQVTLFDPRGECTFFFLLFLQSTPPLPQEYNKVTQNLKSDTVPGRRPRREEEERDIVKNESHYSIKIKAE